MIVNLNFPYIAIKGDGSKVIFQSSATDRLPSSASLVDTVGNNVVLTDYTGNYKLGMYQYSHLRNRWQFVFPYKIICNELFTISQLFVCFPNGGDNLLPLGDTGQALLMVTRNGVSISNYDRISSGIALQLPAVSGDIYGVVTSSPITAFTAIPAGIPDAPVDGNPYVRDDGSWEPLQEFLNEGHFVG